MPLSMSIPSDYREPRDLSYSLRLSSGRNRGTGQAASLRSALAPQFALINRHGRPCREGQPRFGGKFDVFLSSCRCTGCSGTRPSRCPDHCALAAACQRSMTAPPAAPPPMNPASRLPLPPNVLPAELVANVYVLPPTVTVRSRRYNLAGVDNRPEAWTLLTVNFTAEPLGITTFPPDITSCATEPDTVWPILAVLELTDWSVTTEIFVPCGTVLPACANAGRKSANARKTTIVRIRGFISVTSERNLGL